MELSIQVARALTVNYESVDVAGSTSYIKFIYELLIRTDGNYVLVFGGSATHDSPSYRGLVGNMDDSSTDGRGQLYLTANTQERAVNGGVGFGLEWE